MKRLSVYRLLLASAAALGAPAALTQQVIGGGSTLPAEYYGTAVGSGILTNVPLPGFAPYVPVGCGAGHQAFFSNDSMWLGLPAGTTVDYAGCESSVTAAQAAGYAANSLSIFGPLIQVPVALTTVSVPFNVPGLTSLNLTSQQLADIFAGNITTWSAVGGPSQPITVVYRLDSNVATEMLTRHLNAVNSAAIPSVSGTFASVADVSGPNYVGASGSNAVVSAVTTTPFSIGYVSPDFVASEDPTKVATINGWLPSAASLQLALQDVPIPTGGARANPLAWGINNPDPTAGYPIVATTNLIFSQCYANPIDNARIRSFFNAHYTGGNDPVTAYPLPSVWKQAVWDTFYALVTPLSIGNPDVCNGIGRPS
ncbi:substrate-binding domain-containing protein [Achromobacter pestifer]|uniref:Phosphate-binding protein PstS n=1 Tax=Achromobacter pestifer TaxID=1353889 RepID=A0A6S6Z2M6_9BURK|nr:substrate-binding domain-containing protein [Achromobacter pestifer]CAB3647109.1 Alkaline phosphatase L [Achromobacter pestifer]